MKKKIDIKHAIVHAMFQALAGIYYGYGAYMLLRRGFTATTVGFCMSFAGIFSFVFQPLVSNIIDRSEKFTTFSALLVGSSGLCILFLINYLLKTASLFLAIVIVLMGGLYSSHEPFVNSIAYNFERKGMNIEFGVARAAGSICYGVVCAVFGYLTEFSDFTIVTLFGFIFALSFLLSIILIKKDYDSLEDVSSLTKEETVSMKDFIKNHKSFMVLCIFLTGIFLAYVCCDNFMLLITENVGGTSKDMGTILAFKALIEGISMFTFSKAKQKFKITTLLKVTAIFFVLKSLGIVLAKNVVALYLVQLLQALSFGYIFPGMVEFANSIMSRKEASRGQACFTMTITLGSIIASFFAGIIVDNYSVLAMELVALAVSIISAIGFIITVDKAK